MLDETLDVLLDVFWVMSRKAIALSTGRQARLQSPRIRAAASSTKRRQAPQKPAHHEPEAYLEAGSARKRTNDSGARKPAHHQVSMIAPETRSRSMRLSGFAKAVQPG